MNDEIYKKVAARLYQVASAKLRSMPISGDTEVYGDLKIYGDDLFEFFVWVHSEFGVQIAAAGEKYGPPEIPLYRVFELASKVLGYNDAEFKSLKVRDIVDAIEHKSLPLQVHTHPAGEQ